MTVLKKISSGLGSRDEVPNQELAKSIVKENDKAAIKELVANLRNSNKAIQQDCIKVLYEIGERSPKLITQYINDFVELLVSKNNRLQWGGMIALNCVSKTDPSGIYKNLSQIMSAADKGSVITKDHAVNILVNLASVPDYSSDALSLLLEQLKNCPLNQFAMYAERSFQVVNGQNKEVFLKALSARLPEIEKESKRKRIEKVIKELSK
ncbi:MAG: hypothetical protein ABJG47_11170 [Ekhidna sp.]